MRGLQVQGVAVLPVLSRTAALEPRQAIAMAIASDLMTLAATGAGRPMRSTLMAAARELEAAAHASGVSHGVHLVEAVTFDGARESRRSVCAFASDAAAVSRVEELTSTALRVARHIGKEDQVGLEPEERKQLEAALRDLDPAIQVSRYGVRWEVKSMTIERGSR